MTDDQHCLLTKYEELVESNYQIIALLEEQIEDLEATEELYRKRDQLQRKMLIFQASAAIKLLTGEVVLSNEEKDIAIKAHRNVVEKLST